MRDSGTPKLLSAWTTDRSELPDRPGPSSATAITPVVAFSAAATAGEKAGFAAKRRPLRSDTGEKGRVRRRRDQGGEADADAADADDRLDVFRLPRGARVNFEMEGVEGESFLALADDALRQGRGRELFDCVPHRTQGQVGLALRRCQQQLREGAQRRQVF
jgi:hypothetical protein